MTHSSAPYDIDAIRADFPALSLEPYGKKLVYLDNAASAQKPKQVIERMTQAAYYEYANVHRGLHYLANAATDNYEAARESVRAFLNAGSTEEIVFTKSATEAINLVAASFGRDNIQAGDEIVLTILEHHANIVPWHFLRERKGAVIRWVECDDEGVVTAEDVIAAIGPKTKIVAITQMSNVTGTVLPIKEIVAAAHAQGVPVLVDGSQGAVHLAPDMVDLGADFYVLTGHKLYGPTGIGVLYARTPWLEKLPPYLGGGEMIVDVTREGVTYNDPPHRFEAGTPADPRGRRARRGARLHDEDRPVGHRRAREGARRLRDAGARRHELPDDLRSRAGQGRDRLVPDEGRACPRRRHHHRPLRRRGARRHPLRDAADGALRRHLDMPGVVCHVQHDGRGR